MCLTSGAVGILGSGRVRGQDRLLAALRASVRCVSGRVPRRGGWSATGQGTGGRPARPGGWPAEPGPRRANVCSPFTGSSAGPAGVRRAGGARQRSPRAVVWTFDAVQRSTAGRWAVIRPDGRSPFRRAAGRPLGGARCSGSRNQGTRAGVTEPPAGGGRSRRPRRGAGTGRRGRRRPARAFLMRRSRLFAQRATVSEYRPSACGTSARRARLVGSRFSTAALPDRTSGSCSRAAALLVGVPDRRRAAGRCAHGEPTAVLPPPPPTTGTAAAAQPSSPRRPAGHGPDRRPDHSPGPGAGRGGGDQQAQSFSRSRPPSRGWVNENQFPESSRKIASVPYGRSCGSWRNCTPRARSLS